MVLLLLVVLLVVVLVVVLVQEENQLLSQTNCERNQTSALKNAVKPTLGSCHSLCAAPEAKRRPCFCQLKLILVRLLAKYLSSNRANCNETFRK